MSEETLYDLRCYVSDCFNHREAMVTEPKSGYMMLSQLMKEEYDLDNNAVDEVVGDIEQLVAKFIMENSQNFTTMTNEEWNTPMELTQEERKLYGMTAEDYLNFNAKPKNNDE